MLNHEGVDSKQDYSARVDLEKMETMKWNKDDQNCQGCWENHHVDALEVFQSNSCCVCEGSVTRSVASSKGALVFATATTSSQPNMAKVKKGSIVIKLVSLAGSGTLCCPVFSRVQIRMHVVGVTLAPEHCCSSCIVQCSGLVHVRVVWCTCE